MELVNCSLDKMFSDNFAHRFKSRCMSSILDECKDGVLWKIVMHNSKYSCK